jgi:hypothetical protein
VAVSILNNSITHSFVLELAYLVVSSIQNTGFIESTYDREIFMNNPGKYLSEDVYDKLMFVT